MEASRRKTKFPEKVQCSMVPDHLFKYKAKSQMPKFQIHISFIGTKHLSPRVHPGRASNPFRQIH